MSSKVFSQKVIKGERLLVGGAISGMVVLGSIREQDEQARVSNPVKNILCGFCISTCFLTCSISSPDFL
jgi:NAD-dependent dihydropyrimidine dehydrogenase PreA subunit